MVEFSFICKLCMYSYVCVSVCLSVCVERVGKELSLKVAFATLQNAAE